jgi:threonylcarbamoyladenosine tRNA methylthiotransferase MtaB
MVFTITDRSGRSNRSTFENLICDYHLAVTREPETVRPIRRAAIANLGCKVNQSEMEAVARLLRERGVEVGDGHATADLVVVNTCTVTAVADRKSRQILRRVRRLNPDARVYVTGCSVVVDPEALEAADASARLFDNESKGRLFDELRRLLDDRGWNRMPTLSGAEPGAPASRGLVDRSNALEGARAFDLGRDGEDAAEDAGEDGYPEGDGADRTRAFIKIQDGCSFHCTYCIIPRARGSERSVVADIVMADVKAAISAGHREVVLTGINAGTYRSGNMDLAALIRRILADTGVERLRLSSIEPQHVTDDLLAVWAGSEGRCLPHFHVPLQSGDDTILRRMGRRYDTAAYWAVVGRIRAAIPAAAVHADLIVGFPGEDDAAWGRTLAFLRSLSPAGIHVFRYSARPGTPAARMVGQVDGRTKKRRAAEALDLSAQARTNYARALVGSELRVLFERPLSGGRWVGHADNYVPVVAEAAGLRPIPATLANTIGLVRAESLDPALPGRLLGSVHAVDRAPLVGGPDG